MLERLGVGYERMREENPGIVYCAISGYGQDGPKRDASGHDMNYLGLVGLLGLTGERGGAPVQAAGQIADLGGGALMAAFGILAALRERDGDGSAGSGSGEGQLVDVSMADGALSWLAMVAAPTSPTAACPRRGELPLAGSLVCYRPYECADGWVIARRARAEVLAGVVPRRGPRGPDRAQFERPGLGTRTSRCRRSSGAARASSGRRSRASTTAAWSRCSSSTRRSTPSSCARARWSSRSTSRVPSAPCASSASRSSSAARPGEHARLPGPALGEHTEEVLLAAGYTRAGDRRAARRRRRGRDRAARRQARRCGLVSARSMSTADAGGEQREQPGRRRNGALLKMSELAERSGVSPGTIRYYLREGLLGDGEDVVRTSRNMAYYPPEYVERIALIKRLQEQRFMPLRVIKGALEDDPERVRALIELEDRILERALASAEDHSRISRRAAPERYDVPRNVLERLAEIGVLTPNQRGYDRDDVKIIEAIASFRAGRLRRGARASPSTTRCATARRSSRSSPRRSRRCWRRLAGRGRRRARDGDRRAPAPSRCAS